MFEKLYNKMMKNGKLMARKFGDESVIKIIEKKIAIQ